VRNDHAKMQESRMSKEERFKFGIHLHFCCWPEEVYNNGKFLWGQILERVYDSDANNNVPISDFPQQG